MSLEGQRHEPISTHFPEKALSSDHENVSTALVQQSLSNFCMMIIPDPVFLLNGGLYLSRLTDS